MRIICLSSPPVNEGKVREIFGNEFDDQARTNEGCRIYSEALIELCREMDVEAINLQFGKETTGKCLDRTHLSAEVSEVVVEEILKVLKKANWEPSLFWLSMAFEFPEDSPHYVVNPDGKSTFNVSNFISCWQRQWLDI